MKELNDVWSLDLFVNLYNCNPVDFDEKLIKNICQAVGNKIDPKGEVCGVVTQFGNHCEDMKGYRSVHETENSLITGHFVLKNKNVFFNVHSCRGYRPSEVLKLLEDLLEPESHSWHKIYRK